MEGAFAKAGGQLKPFAAEKIEKFGCQKIFSHITQKKQLVEVLQRALAGSDTSTSLSDSINLEEELPMITDKSNEIHKMFSKLVGKGNLNAEFDCVLVLQLVHHNLGAPKGLMTRLLQDFYYADLLTEDAFNKWRDDNTDQTPGKVKAITDSTNWLNWLANEENEDSDDKE